MDVSAVLLNKILTEKDLDIWARTKLVYLDSVYLGLYSAICKHYDKYNVLPSFDDLELTLRDGQTSNTLAIVKTTVVPEVDSEVILDALIDQYTQTETISLLDKFITKLPIYDTNEIKENLSSIALTLEEKTFTSEKVYTMADMLMFQRPEVLSQSRVYLGLNNEFDSQLGGVAREELILIGGKRGAGKSITSSNLFVNQYEAGNSCLYFTIEMTAMETVQRNLSILANIPIQALKKNELTEAETLRLVQVRADMFADSDKFVQEFKRTGDRYKFEESLVKHCTLKSDNQMIIVDDRDLSIASIDLHISKVKARFGDKLTLAVIDYLNQIVIDGSDQYDWKPQIEVSKKLKNLARKHNIVIVSPYQIDASGEARFAKGILDAADIAITMEAHAKEESAISFNTTKIRGAREAKFTSPINWNTLRISPISIERPVAETSKKPKKESVSDLPWED